MSKSFQKTTAAVATALMLLMILASTAFAAPNTKTMKFVALGDSISLDSFQLSVTGYTKLFADYLGSSSMPSNKYVNYSISGSTSGKLLFDVLAAKNSYENGYPNQLFKDLHNAKIITVSIGSNDLMGVVIGAIAQAYGVNPAANDFLLQLAAKIKENPTILFNLSNTLDPNLLGGAALSFAGNWTNIVKTIKIINPKAAVYVNNIYNPMFDPVYLASVPNELKNFYTAFYGALEATINNINGFIVAGAQNGAYKVIDVNTKFQEAFLNSFSVPGTYKPPVNFNLYQAAVLTSNPNSSPVQIAQCLDPHPTQYGQNLILELLSTK